MVRIGGCMFRNSITVKLLVIALIILTPIVAMRTVNIIYDYDNELKEELDDHINVAEVVSSLFANDLREIWIIEDVIGNFLNERPYKSSPEIKSYLDQIRERNGDIVNISLIDPEGRIIASSGKMQSGAATAASPYFDKIYNGENNGENRVVSDIIDNPVEPGRIFMLAKSVKTEDGSMGMIVAAIDAKRLEKVFPDIKIYGDKLIQLIDRNGALVYSNEKGQKPDNMEESLIDEPGVGQALQGNLSVVGKGQSVKGNTLIMSASYPVTDTGWVCRVSSPYHNAMAHYYRSLWIEVFTLVIIILFFITAAFVWGKSFIKPAVALKMAAEKIMDGDYSARTNIKSRNEIGLTAQAFDKMVESIQQWDDVKTQFFTNISHEIKTPLNVIFSSVQLVESYKLSMGVELYQEKVNRQMKIIRQNCYRIMRLVTNLIDISRHDSGFLKVKLSNYDIIKLVREITGSVRRYTEAKGLKLIFTSDTVSKIMACDPDMIERILLNLISNAIKFTDRGGTITVSMKDGGDEIILTVKDTGTGIPEDKLNTIFERFKQADDPYNRNREGSGIGLSLVTAFVREHGGTISVTSEYMKGTAFEIHLPVRIIESSQNKSLNEEKAAYAVSSGAVSRINIEFSDIYNGFDDIA